MQHIYTWQVFFVKLSFALILLPNDYVQVLGYIFFFRLNGRLEIEKEKNKRHIKNEKEKPILFDYKSDYFD